MFVLMVLIMAVFFIMMRRLGGAGSAMAFGRSRGKLYAQEDLGITFNDVAGIDEAVDELREVVDFLRSPEKYQRPRRTNSQGRAAGRSAGHRQDAAGQGDRRRGGRAVLQPLRLRLRRDVRRRRRRPRPRHVPAGPGQGPLHRLHRRIGRPGQDPRQRHGRRTRRARANAQRPAGRDGRLQLEQRRDRDGRHEPARNARSGPVAARSIRPPRAGRSARRRAAASRSSRSTSPRSSSTSRSI